MGGRCGGRSVGRDRCEITSGALRGIGNAVAIQQAAFQGDGGRPVEVLQAAGLLEAGALKPQFNAPVGAVIDLVAEDDLQEGCIVQLLSAGFCGGRLLPGRGHGNGQERQPPMTACMMRPRVLLCCRSRSAARPCPYHRYSDRQDVDLSETCARERHFELLDGTLTRLRTDGGR